LEQNGFILSVIKREINFLTVIENNYAVVAKFIAIHYGNKNKQAMSFNGQNV
jgi:hypothetical protein